jgi:putative NADH-flavin reductase
MAGRSARPRRVKALIDEQLTADIAERLRGRGHDVVAVTERADLMRQSDEHLMQAAAAEHRAIVTNNVKDFRPIAAARLAAGHGHAGLILVPSTRTRTRAATHELVDAVAAILDANPGGLASSERWLAPLA